MTKDKLRVQGMIFHAFHGLDHGERVRQVYAKVQKVVVNERFYLIETISQRIAELILHEFDVDEVTVKVRKPFAPLGGLANGTEIEITRKK
jgi:dihydroneopterin aldolase